MPESAPAEVVVTADDIVTGDPARPRVAAIAWRRGVIVAAGSEADVSARTSAGARWFRLGARTVLPGLVDSHIHLAWYGETLDQLTLDGARDLPEALARISARAARTPPDGWIIGHGWDQNAWPAGERPPRAALDQAGGGRPVYVASKDGHAAWVSSEALRRAGLSAASPDPPGGLIERDARGEPTGIVKDRAMEVVRAILPRPSAAELRAAVQRAAQALLAMGITAVHVPEDLATVEACAALAADGDWHLRVVAMLPLDRLDEAIARGLYTGAGDEWIRIGPVKMFADGSLGSQTAALLTPYCGAAHTGLQLLWGEALREAIGRAVAHRFVVAVHAIGDAANREVLDALAAVGRAGRAGAPPLRHRIEHVQLLHPADLPRLAAQGIVASMQPLHCPSDRDLADRLWGGRARYAYAFRSLLRCGTILAFGSDAPVVSPDPRLGLHAAVCRRAAGDPRRPPWYPAERLTLDEAIAAYTSGPAWATGQEDRAGRLSPGFRADVTIFDANLHALDPEAIPAAPLFATVVGGRFVHGAWEG